MKKLFKLMLVLALVVTQFIGITSVSAAETTGKITINASDGQTENGAVTYNIYKIFDLSLNEAGNAYRYTITENSPWYAFFTTGAGKDYVTLTASEPATTFVVTWKAWAEGMTDAQIKDAMAKLAKDALAYAKVAENEVTVTATTTIAQGGTTATVENLELGYYLVDSTLGSLCALDTTNRAVTINEKNTVPTIKKEVAEDEDGTNFGTTSNAQIGDTVNYKTTITVAAGAINYELHDKMEAGLTFNDKSVEIKVGDKILVSGTDYTLTSPSGEETFLIKFNNETIKELKVGDQIVVTYSATLNEKAEIKDASNDNTTYLKYGDNIDLKTDEEKTETYSFSFDLVKTNVENDILEGAKFKLYDTDQKTEIPVVEVKDNDGKFLYYRVAVEGENGVEIEAGRVTIKGLDGNTTYWLEETVAPEGYNKLTTPVQVAIGTSNLDMTITLDGEGNNVIDGGIEVENNTGTELPETGGMGTVMFITVGSLMVMGFGVLLVTKFRLSKES